MDDAEITEGGPGLTGDGDSQTTEVVAHNGDESLGEHKASIDERELADHTISNHGNGGSPSNNQSDNSRTETVSDLDSQPQGPPDADKTRLGLVSRSVESSDTTTPTAQTQEQVGLSQDSNSERTLPSDETESPESQEQVELPPDTPRTNENPHLNSVLLIEESSSSTDSTISDSRNKDEPSKQTGNEYQDERQSTDVNEKRDIDESHVPPISSDQGSHGHVPPPDSQGHVPPPDSHRHVPSPDSHGHVPPPDSDQESHGHVPPPDSDQESHGHMPPPDSDQESHGHVPPPDSDQESHGHVPPLDSQGHEPPLNVVSLDGEMDTVKQTEETLPHKVEYRSQLLKSAGIHLQTNGNNTGEELSETRILSAQTALESSDVTSIPLRSLQDRNLEEFSEILLDSDTSSEPPSSPTNLGGALLASENTRRRVEKRVRFADEVEKMSPLARTSNSATATASVTQPRALPSLPGLATSEGGEVQKHPGVPVSPSPTSPNKSTVPLPPSPSHTDEELVAGVEYSAEYLGSTPIILTGSASKKTARMQQAQRAVQLIKDPENDSQPHFSVKVKISTAFVKIADGHSDVDLMEHPLHTISYVADIDNMLVMMAYRSPPPPTDDASPEGEGEGHTPRMTCHVLETEDARHLALVIGQAFSVAYKEFLRANGISEEALEEAEYAHVLNAQSVPQAELETVKDRNKNKKLTLAKHKGEAMGIMVMESGYGSAVPTCVIAHMSKTGAASKSGLLNVGDHIFSINGVSLVGMPLKQCVEHIKKCRQQSIVKLVVCSCPTVVDVTIVRPDLKFQLGFSVQDGVVVSLMRGSIAERSGIRVGHSIIEINGTSAVGMNHDDIVHLLATTVGDLHLRTMPYLMYRLITGQTPAEYH